jgi:hypothetical protein
MDVLELFKFLGIFISFVAGVLATAYETKDRASTKLNRAGKALLSLVILGAFTTAVTQYLDDSQAAKDRSADLKRLSFIITNAERLANPLSPVIWSGIIRYKLEPSSPLWAYAQRMRKVHTGWQGYDLRGDDLPRRDDPAEAKAWDYLVQPRVGLDIKLIVPVHPTRAVPAPIPINPYPLYVLDGTKHSDPDMTWQPGPYGDSPPFDARMWFEKKGGNDWLGQQFFIRNPPPQPIKTKVTSPIELSGATLITEVPQDPYMYVDSIVLEFPTGTLFFSMGPSESTYGFNVQKAQVDPADVRKAFDLPELDE